MKNLLSYSFLLALAFTLFSCDKDEEKPGRVLAPYSYFWDAVTLPLTVPSSAFDRTFRLKNDEGYNGGIIGVPYMWAKIQQDTVNIRNLTLEPAIEEDSSRITQYFPSVKSDTITGKWFTVINEEKKQLRIILDKNEETETRFLKIEVWTSGNPQVQSLGDPLCERFVIFQHPSKSE